MERDYLPFVAIAIAGLSYLATHYRTKSTVDLAERLAKIETRVEVYFDLQERYNAVLLHRPTHKEVDELLETRERLEPLPEDADRKLDRELEEIIYDKEKPLSLRAAAVQMLAARKARSECA